MDVNTMLNRLNPPFKYIDILQKDIQDNEKEQEKLATEVNKINQIIENLIVFSERPEWPNSFIEVNPLAYVPATIIHTNEYRVKLSEDYYSLMSLKETLEYLKRKIGGLQKIIDSYKVQHKQLVERYKFYNDTGLETVETKNMPAEIASEKGTAYKMSVGFYEVIEPYVEEEEQTFYKIRKCTQKSQKTEVYKEEDDALFKRLDELEEQEILRREFKEDEEFSGNINEGGTDVYQRTKTILSESDLYQRLLSDSLIQEYCLTAEEQKIENALNNLVIKTLKNYEEKEITLKRVPFNEVGTKNQTDISENDRIVTAFLNNIENI